MSNSRLGASLAVSPNLHSGRRGPRALTRVGLWPCTRWRAPLPPPNLKVLSSMSGMLVCTVHTCCLDPARSALVFNQLPASFASEIRNNCQHLAKKWESLTSGQETESWLAPIPPHPGKFHLYIRTPSLCHATPSDSQCCATIDSLDESHPCPAGSPLLNFEHQ